MTIELSKDERAQAIASIERYFLENMDEQIGNVAAGGLLEFFVRAAFTTRLWPTLKNACNSERRSLTSRFMRKSSPTGERADGRQGRPTSLGWPAGLSRTKKGRVSPAHSYWAGALTSWLPARRSRPQG